ncbi:MAG: hypothetical protein IPM38_07610 [Ignavibacteria bacterium]|nr:hypothetical protein [Ignavibacteria bacterium]
MKSLIKNLKYRNLIDPRLKYPVNKFVIYTRGRTGSTLLTELLNCHPEIYCDVEIFNFIYSGSIINFPELYIKSCSKRASASGKSVYGFKVKIGQLRFEHKYKDYEKILMSLHEQGWKFIHLKRVNLLRHKLSNIITYQTDIFHLRKNDEEFNKKIIIDCKQLLKGIKYGEEVEKTEEENLKNIPHMKIIYEDDLLDNSIFQRTADRVFNFLGINSYPVKSELKRITKENLEDVIENYKEVEKYFMNTEHEKYLH